MQETIGQRLKRAREYRNISLEKAGEITRIRPALLTALEADDFSSMVSAAQARGFLRNYSDYLGVNLDDFLAQLEPKPTETDAIPTPVSPEQIVGPLEKIEPGTTGVGSANDPSKTKRELPFWKRTVSWLPSRERQLLDIQEPETINTEIEIPGKAELPIETEAKPGSTPEVEEQVKPSESESQPTSSTAVLQPVSEQVLTVHAAEGTSNAIQQGKNKHPTIIDRLKAVFRIRLSGLQASSKPAEPESIEQITGEAAQLPARLTESPGKSVEEYFVEIGEKLRERRTLLSLTFEEIERHTHIRTPFLKALENGTHDQLPSPVQTRGLLSNYATFLDLDADQLLLSYATALQARHREKHPELARSNATLRAKPILPPIRTFIASDVLFGVGVVGIVIGLAVWGLGRLLNPPSVQQSVESTAPSIAEVLAGTAIAQIPQEVTLIPAQDTPLPTFEATQEVGQGDQELAAGDIRVQVSLLAVARTFVRVTSDGEVVFNDQVIPGTSYPFEADQQVEILAGNGAALKVTYGGRDLGLMGNLGEVVNRIYTLSGISTPTITPLPSATATPPITSTPTYTATPTQTP